MIKPSFFLIDHLKSTHKPPKSFFPYYFAGLIQSFQFFLFSSSNFFLLIPFHILDASLVFYIQRQLGFGHILYKFDRIFFLIHDRNLHPSLSPPIPSLPFAPFRSFPSSSAPFFFAGFLDGSLSSFSFNLHLNLSLSSPPFPLHLFFEIHLPFPPFGSLFWLFFGPAPLIFHSSHFPFFPSSSPFLRLKFPFPHLILRRLFFFFDLSPFLSLKFIKYLKFRKIYRICQRKEHLTKKGLFKILSLWRFH